MKRSISVERLYTLGDYKNIKIVNTLDDIPEEISSDPDKVEALFKTLVLECDLAYQNYQELTKEAKDLVLQGKEVTDTYREMRNKLNAKEGE